MKVICNGYKTCDKNLLCKHAKPHKENQFCDLHGIDTSEYDNITELPCYCNISPSEIRKRKLKIIIKNEYK